LKLQTVQLLYQVGGLLPQLSKASRLLLTLLLLLQLTRIQQSTLFGMLGL
jgi:hypothetical protein